METLAQDSPGAGRGEACSGGWPGSLEVLGVSRLSSRYVGAHVLMCRLCIYETLYDTLKKVKGGSAYFSA